MIQFAVWGAGTLGKIVMDMLGAERIAVCIDNNKERQGTAYRGTPVLSYEQYQEKFSHIPIIITPKGYETAVAQQLNQNDGLIAYKWLEEMDALRGFWMQAPREKVLKPYAEKERIIVYGDCLLSVILTFFFRDRGYAVDNIFPQSMNERRKKYYEEIFKMNPADLKDVQEGIILGQELQEADKLLVQEQGISTDSFYDLGLKKELYHNPAIERFKDIHRNERCFIVATGPSLRMEDLNTLHEKGEICISVNGILRAFDKTEWRPDYYVVSDAACTMAWREKILELDVKEKFIADIAWIYGDEDVDAHIYKWHLQIERYDNEYPEFSEDFSRLSYWGDTVTYEGALQLAVYLGFKEIYLLGVDCSYNGNKMEHFIEDYFCAGFVDVDHQRVIRSYQSAKRYAEEHGIKIYNATRGGELEVFERRDFDSL